MSLPRRKSRARIETRGTIDESMIPIAEVTAIAVDQYFKGGGGGTTKKIGEAPTSSSAPPRTRGWPASLRKDVLSSFTKKPNVEAARKFLESHCWPSGLIEAFCLNIVKVPIRFFLVDDSGSMNTADGFKVIGGQQDQKVISCTRWSELSSTVSFHAHLAEAVGAPTEASTQWI